MPNIQKVTQQATFLDLQLDVTCKSVQSLLKQIKDRIELLIFLRYSMSCSCRISCRYSISCFKCLCKCHKNCNRPPLKKDEKRSSLAMFYKIYNDQTRIDTVKYLKPLSRVSCRVNSQAYDQVPVAYLLFWSKNNKPGLANRMFGNRTAVIRLTSIGFGNRT